MLRQARGAALAISLAAALVSPPHAMTEEVRTFAREDYVDYFEPGRFESHSPYYGSEGVMEVVRNRVIELGGRRFLEQTVRSLDVSANYDALSEYPYYKIRSEGMSRMLWDEAKAAYVFDYSRADFERDDSEVFESRRPAPEILAEDRPRGRLHAFYRRADQRAGRDVDAMDRAYQADVIGAWSMQCAFVSKQSYDVACRLTHLPSERVEQHYYRKLDLIG
jgi:hypothetical protein